MAESDMMSVSRRAEGKLKLEDGKWKVVAIRAVCTEALRGQETFC